jgi:ABC-2 type transport system permease protein
VVGSAAGDRRGIALTVAVAFADVRAGGGSEVYARLVVAGFRRWSTYRTAALAGMSTNLVFGFLRCAVLLTVFGGAAEVAGYDRAAAVTFVWTGQALIDLTLAWGGIQFGERVRSGDVATDLLRPWDLQLALLADDLGRAGFSLLIRFVPPFLVAGLFFDLRLPGDVPGWALFALGVLLAVLVGFGMRFLVNLTAFWLMDWRGVFGLYIVLSSLLCGLTVPVAMLPRWAEIAVWCTPFPAMMQVPADLLVGRGNPLLLLGHAFGWTVVMLLLGRLALRRAVRALVVQGG